MSGSSVLSAQDETRTHTILRPLPPQSSVYTNFTTCALMLISEVKHPLFNIRLSIFTGAENETRTRDPNLGKVVLYQLSYFRIF